tara:strand:- start:527 stop:724 length:198 start_codon:yes stop_codon:yes gene_type:complete
MPSTPRKSPREAEACRLRAEANGRVFKPAKPGTLYEARRENLIEQYVAEGLDKFDQEQQGIVLNP